MVSYDSLKFAATVALMTLAIEHLPGPIASIWRNGVVKSLKSLIGKVYLETGAGKKKLEEGDREVREKLEHMMLEGLDELMETLPSKGMSEVEILAKFNRLTKRDKEKWASGKISGGVYSHEEDDLVFIGEVMKPFMLANQLHPDLFPAARQLESEVVQMVAGLFHPTPETCGILTSGGTESLLMMIFAYREWGRARGIKAPEIVASRTVHPAVAKGGCYFGVKIVYVDVDPDTMEVDLKAVERAITKQTVALIGSMPSFPHGVCDSIEGLSDIAVRKGVNLHVDCCLGGFLVPFLKEVGCEIPPFDFELPGVTSLSCDPHKYGCTPKGVSVVLYCSHELRHYQYFMQMDWMGGLYCTPGIGGSRTGLMATTAWAMLVKKGREGYVRNTKAIMDCVRTITEGIRDIPDIQIIGRPQASVLAFTSATTNIYAIGEMMEKHSHWSLNFVQHPSGFHIAVTRANCHMGEEFLEDLKEAVRLAKELKEPAKTDAAVLYGIAGTLPNISYMKFVGDAYLDTLYKTRPSSPS